MPDLVYEKGISEIEMPEFVRGYAMEGGKLTFGQQEIDTGGNIPGTLEKYGERILSYGELGSVNFPEGSSFDVGCQLQVLDPIGCIGSLHTIQCSMVTWAAYTSASESLIWVVSRMVAMMGK